MVGTMDLVRTIAANVNEFLRGSSKRQRMTRLLLQNFLEDPSLTRNAPKSTIRATEGVDLRKVVDDAIRKIGGITIVDANPEALLDELEYCEGLNLMDVHKHIQILKKIESLKGNELQDESMIVEDVESWQSPTKEEFITPTGKGEGVKIRGMDENRETVIEKYRSSLSSLDMPEDEIEDHMKAEKEMRRFCALIVGYQFDKDTLVQLWIASGFIWGEHKYHIADLYFEILLSNGDITHSSTCFPSEKSMYKVVVAQNMKNEEHNFRLIDERMALVGDAIDKYTLERLKKFQKLKALLLLCNNAQNITSIPRDVFLILEHLEVLDLSNTQITELSDCVAKLVNLRYLDLSHTLIDLLPEKIACLSKLQTLRLKDCRRLLRLPENIGKLTSLENLELDVLNQLTFMPRGIGSLTQLKTLSAFLIHKGDSRGIQELENMNKLEGKLCISGLENVLGSWEAEKAALSKKNIKELELRWSDLRPSWGETSIHNGEGIILDQLRPSVHLEKLLISCYNGPEFPSWISDSAFDKLANITLFKCEYFNGYQSLGKLPSLKYLSLFDLAKVYKIGTQLRGVPCWDIVESNIPKAWVAFPKLERLTIVNFSELVFWEEFDDRDYPNLSELIVEQCPVLESLPSSVLRLCTLKHLEVISCTRLASFLDTNLSTSMVTLIIEDCPMVMRWIKSIENKKDWRMNIRHVKNVRIDQDDN